jgi:bromodomain-containing protein 7/9
LPKLLSFAFNPSVSKQRRHWVITRNVTRSKGKEKDDDQEVPEAPAWKNPREAHVSDFGSFAFLAGALEEEMRRRQVRGHEGEEEEKLFEAIRESLDLEAVAAKTDISDHVLGKAEYWSTQRAAAAEEYIRDAVYGGVGGLAYIRSLAEFVTVGQRQVSLYHRIYPVLADWRRSSPVQVQILECLWPHGLKQIWLIHSLKADICCFVQLLRSLLFLMIP